MKVRYKLGDEAVIAELPEAILKLDMEAQDLAQKRLAKMDEILSHYETFSREWAMAGAKFAEDNEGEHAEIDEYLNGYYFGEGKKLFGKDLTGYDLIGYMPSGIDKVNDIYMNYVFEKPVPVEDINPFEILAMLQKGSEGTEG